MVSTAPAVTSLACDLLASFIQVGGQAGAVVVLACTPPSLEAGTDDTRTRICNSTLNPHDAGLIGTAPSKELLDIWNEREDALVAAGPEATTLGGVLHTRPLGTWLRSHIDEGVPLALAC